MNVGKLYTIRLVEDQNTGIDPRMVMDPLPLDLNSPCMKNKCMKIKKHLKPRHDFDHDYMVDILNKLDGSMSMPNVKIMSNMFKPKLLNKKSKKKKGKKKHKNKKLITKSLSRTLSLPDLLSDDLLSEEITPFKNKRNVMLRSSNSIEDIIKKEFRKKKKKTKKKKQKKKKKNKPKKEKTVRRSSKKKKSVKKKRKQRSKRGIDWIRKIMR